MDDTLHDRASGRDESAHDAGHDKATPCDRPSADTAPATRPVTPSTVESNIVVICAWCPQLHILKIQRRDVDVIVVFQLGKELRIVRNGVNLDISHGICQPCRERLHR